SVKLPSQRGAVRADAPSEPLRRGDGEPAAYASGHDSEGRNSPGADAPGSFPGATRADRPAGPPVSPRTVAPPEDARRSPAQPAQPAQPHPHRRPRSDNTTNAHARSSTRGR